MSNMNKQTNILSTFISAPSEPSLEGNFAATNLAKVKIGIPLYYNNRVNISVSDEWVWDALGLEEFAALLVQTAAMLRSNKTE